LVSFQVGQHVLGQVEFMPNWDKSGPS